MRPNLMLFPPFLKTLLFIVIAVFFFSSCNKDEEDVIEYDVFTEDGLQDLLLSENISYSELDELIESQKIYFVNNSGEEEVYIYELSLDYDRTTDSVALSPHNVFLRAERFVYLGFRAHIAATIDGQSIVALENGGTNIAVIDIATKEVTLSQKPSASLTQVGFNLDGELYAAGGDKFYQVDNWNNGGSAEFTRLNYEGLPKISGGDLLFLNDPERPWSFLSFSKGNSENDGDAAYFIDIIEKDGEGNPSVVSYQKLFEIDPNVTGACVVADNHFITTHKNKDKANIYSFDGNELFKVPIRNADGERFVAGYGDLASVNNLDENFFDDHIQNGEIYLSSIEEGKFYKLDLDNGDHEVMRAYDGKLNSHIGFENNTLFYTLSKTGFTRGLYAWNQDTGTDTLVKTSFTGEKFVVHNNQAWLMGGNNLRVLDLATNEIIHRQKFPEIGGGGDLLMSKNGAELLVFDRAHRQVWKINTTDYSLSAPINVAVTQMNGAAYNRDGTIIVSSRGSLYILDENFEVIGQKLLGFIQNNGDMASSY